MFKFSKNEETIKSIILDNPSNDVFQKLVSRSETMPMERLFHEASPYLVSVADKQLVLRTIRYFCHNVTSPSFIANHIVPFFADYCEIDAATVKAICDSMAVKGKSLDVIHDVIVDQLDPMEALSLAVDLKQHMSPAIFATVVSKLGLFIDKETDELIVAMVLSGNLVMCENCLESFHRLGRFSEAIKHISIQEESDLCDTSSYLNMALRFLVDNGVHNKREAVLFYNALSQLRSEIFEELDLTSAAIQSIPFLGGKETSEVVVYAFSHDLDKAINILLDIGEVAKCKTILSKPVSIRVETLIRLSYQIPVIDILSKLKAPEVVSNINHIIQNQLIEFSARNGNPRITVGG